MKNNPEKGKSAEVGTNFLARLVALDLHRSTNPDNAVTPSLEEQRMAKKAYEADPNGFMDSVMSALGEIWDRPR